MPSAPVSEVAAADFSLIRYAQCWEDADVLLQALDVQPGDACLSITSAGDNTLSLLTRCPSRILAVDLSPAQAACLEIRMAAIAHLSHPELLELMGARPSTCRTALYARLRPHLSPAARRVWDAHPGDVAAGIGGAGKFERYLALFRRFVLPLIHSRSCVAALFEPRSREARGVFFAQCWNTWRWRVLARLFSSRRVSAAIGRDPAFFRYVEGGVAERVLRAVERALTDLDPSDNPYLHWIAFGQHGDALPHWLRPDHFDAIRTRLDRIEVRIEPLETCLYGLPDATIDRFNLSDIFEYVSKESAAATLAEIVRVGRRGGRLAYWNTFVPRSRPPALARRLRPLTSLAERLHTADRVFFYQRFVVEELA
jgi:S-adenosylmethionine-diacylglycerol 3-amino-3-carboxypropyl transferase